jgi:hypothetical protein
MVRLISWPRRLVGVTSEWRGRFEFVEWVGGTDV